ncbi:MAG: ROK family protein [Vicinamibacterales bacterium]
MAGFPTRFRLGIDLGGTKIAAVVLDDRGRVAWEARRPTPREDYDATLAAIAAVVAEGEGAVGGPCSVGLGTPGAVSPATGRMKNANSTWLNDRPFREDLEARLGRPVRLANDANCLAVSEAADGAAAGAHVVFGVILGTGAGGGIVVGGQPWTGANAVAGEWGHTPLPWPADDERPGPACYCGRAGCLETFLSGPGLAADHARSAGTRLAPEEVVRRATDATGADPHAVAALDRWHDRLARGLAVIVTILDPDVIVVGGGLSRLESIYSRVPERWGRWVFSDRVDTRLVPAAHGDASGVRGAARLWPGAGERAGR